MRRKLIASGVFFTVLLGVTSAQQVKTSNSTTVSGSDSVSTDKSGASAQANNKVYSSSQTTVIAPAHESEKGNKPTRHSDGPKGQANRSPDTTTSLAVGASISAVLRKPIDSRKCKPGDPLIATAAENV